MINDNINNLIEVFNKIKNKPLNKSLRCGTTGIGYTFESLLDKREDNNFLPDFNGIEIKTRLGYTKSPITLFTLTPKRDNISSIPYILSNYGYSGGGMINSKKFMGDVYYKRNNIIANKFILKTKLDRINNKLILLIFDKTLNVIDNSISWDLNELYNRLTTKLSYLAIIRGYPYIIDKIKYYKYTNIDIYSLKDFDTFLSLIENDIIHITFNIDIFKGEYRNGDIHDHGTAFRIYHKDILNLFNKIY